MFALSSVPTFYSEIRKVEQIFGVVVKGNMWIVLQLVAYFLKKRVERMALVDFLLEHIDFIEKY